MSLSYLRFGGAASSSHQHTPLSASDNTPDFGAFDSDDDDDEADSHPSQPRRSGTAAGGQAGGGAIALGEEHDDPLQSSSVGDGRPNHYQASRSPPHAIVAHDSERGGMPGSYDFEPQSALAPASSSSTSPPSSASSYNRNDAPRTRSVGLSFRERLMPGALYARLSNRPAQRHEAEDEASGLLFESSAEETDSESPSHSSSSYPPRNSHVPLPARPPQFSAPPPSGPGAQGGRVFGGGQSNDGVFANLSAKPEGAQGADFVGGDEEGGNKDEVLPAYEVAAMDTTPPYWETTVITPGGVLGPDDICVDGLPVGNLFGFAWNLLVSMSFQFVGFLLTYLLHTTHAAKNGSRAGLGITLIQLGFYLKQRAEHPELFPDMTYDPSLFNSTSSPYVNPQLDPNDPANWSWWGGVVAPSPSSIPSATSTALGSLPTQIHGALSGMLSASDPDIQEAMRNGSMPSLTGNGVTQEELMKMSSAANEWMSFFMVTVGSFLVIGACLSYWRAVRWARAVRAGQGPGADQENMLRSFLAH